MARKASAALDLDGLIMAAPVSRDGFSFNGRFLTVVVENTTHERCDSATLYALLTHVDPPPVRTKAGTIAKRQPPAYQDRPGHFYCAQLLHYGLKALKTKDAAKKRLLDAYDSNRSMLVPTSIVQLEQKLRAEFTKINDAAVAQYRAERGHVGEAAGPPTSKKAKKEKKATAEIIMPAIPSGQIATQAQPTRPKQTARKSPPPEHAVQPRKKQTAVKAGASVVPPFADWEEDEDIKPRTKQTARKTGPSVFPAFVPDVDVKPRTKQTAKKTSSAATRLKLAKEVNSLPEAERIKFIQSMLQEMGQDGEDFVRGKLTGSSTVTGSGNVITSGSKSKMVNYIGQYDVAAPEILDSWTCYGDKFTLKLAVSWGRTEHLWGSFEFGVISGIIRSKGRVPQVSATDAYIPSGSSISFTWRGRESGEDVITIGDRNTGTIEFLANGNLKGVIKSDLGNFKFSGKKVPIENVVWSKSIPQWKDMWRSTSDAHYEYENTSRWGKWVEEPRQDRPEDSDSSTGGGMDSEDNDADDDDVEVDSIGYYGRF